MGNLEAWKAWLEAKDSVENIQYRVLLSIEEKLKLILVMIFSTQIALVALLVAILLATLRR